MNEPAFRLPGRADHVGSLLRPPELMRAFHRFRDGEIDEKAFAAIQDRAIREVVALQEGVGLKAITDGEFRRASYWGRLVERVEGLEVKEALFAFRDESGRESAFTAPHVAAPVRRVRPIAEDEFLFLRATTRETPKITLPSPPTMHFWRLDAGIAPAAYRDPQAFFADLAAIYREEIAHLAGLGASYVQLDEVPLAMLCDPDIRAKVRARGQDPERLIDDYVALLDAALRERPAGMIGAVHLCRGNFKGRFLAAGGYEEIADKLFNQVAADAYFLEYDTERAGDFAPLRLLPADKCVVLGLVSSKRPALESVEGLRRRIDEAARLVDLDRLAISPQCGFASTVGGNPVTVEIERAKLALLVEVAGAVWGTG